MKKEELKQQLEEASKHIEIKGEKPLMKSKEQIEAEKSIEAWKKEKHKQIYQKEFIIPNQLLQAIVFTKEYNGMILYGEGGIGKTFMTLNSIKKFLKPNEWEYSNGYTTPLALYELLYKHRDKKVIILDDVEGVFNNPLSISILKGGLWDSDGKRIVQYKSKSKIVDDLPSAFVLGAKIIILCNSIPHENDVSIRAMISRTIAYKMVFSYEQKLNLCNQFIDQRNDLTKKQKDKAKQLLIDYTNEATKDFSFRTIKKAITFIKYNGRKAEEVFEATTQKDEVKHAYLQAVKGTLNIKAQIMLFEQYCGRGRRTFFRVKREMSDKVT